MEMTQPSPFNLAELCERCLGDCDFAKELLSVFESQVPDRLTRLRAAMDGSMFGHAAGEAHALKGSAGNLAAKDMQTAMAALERALRDNEIEHALALLAPALATAEIALDAVPDVVRQLTARKAA
ncbi:MAG: Hpt domain-containing protein [Tepidisphaeraceae bacterium]